MADLHKDGGDETLLGKFVHLAKYFNPRDNMDPKSPYSVKTINAEKIFAQIIGDFNPYGHHQDCQEFLELLLEKLHDELALLHEPGVTDDVNHSSSESENKGKETMMSSEWSEVGAGNQQKRFNNDENSLTQASLI